MSKLSAGCHSLTYLSEGGTGQVYLIRSANRNNPASEHVLKRYQDSKYLWEDLQALNSLRRFHEQIQGDRFEIASAEAVNSHWTRLPYFEGMNLQEFFDDQSFSKNTKKRIALLYEQRIKKLLDYLYILHPDNSNTIKYETEEDLGLAPTGRARFCKWSLL